uniref:EF-hand domain-containing protein n=2 Tax=Emiliania huxleyi TaxID=2903 RepID=A0A6V2V508_EMIHU
MQEGHGASLSVSAAFDWAAALCQAAGVVAFLVVACLGMYRMVQTTLLAWDTDGDGIVEFHEVKAVVLLYSRAALAKFRRSRVDSRPSRASAVLSAESAPGAEGAVAVGARPLSASTSRSRPSALLAAAELEQARIAPKNAFFGILDAISKLHFFLWALVLWLALYPAAFNSVLLRPCWDCDDLSAALAKGLGQALGLHTRPSPANATDGGFYFNTTAARYNCSEPLGGVEPLLEPAAFLSLMGSAPRASALAADWATSSVAPVRCPTADDAAGLRVLYPECDQLLSCQYGSFPASPPPSPPLAPVDVSISPPPPSTAATEYGCIIYTESYANAQPGVDAGEPYVPAEYYRVGLSKTDVELEAGWRRLAPPRCLPSGNWEARPHRRVLLL